MTDTKQHVRAPEVIVLGEPLICLAPTDVGQLADKPLARLTPAGDALNVAIALARAGVPVALVSAIGKGWLGEAVQRALDAEGVDTSRLNLAPGMRTGIVMKSRPGDGSDPKVEYDRSGTAASRLTSRDIDWGFVVSASHLHVSGILPALSADTCRLTIDAILEAKQAGLTVSFDPNLRAQLWPGEDAMRDTINEIASMADWIFFNIKEARLLTRRDTLPAMAGYYLEDGVATVVIKQGAQGAYVRTKDGEEFHVPPHPVPADRVVDPVGAGDGFAAGVIGGRLEGLSWHAAVRRGNFVGAHIVQHPGDWEGAPHRDQYPDWARGTACTA